MGRATRTLACALAAGLALAACTDEAPSSATSPPGVDGSLTWQRLADAPTARTEVAAAAGQGRIAVVGGYLADGATVARVELLDLETGRWEPGPDLPVAVNHAMAAAVNDRVYVFGGYLAGDVPSAGAFRLEPGGWRAVAALPEARAAGTAVAVEGRVYIAGGIAPGRRLADSMLVYDAPADRWSTAQGPPTQREHLGGAGFGGLVYTVGGRTGGLSGNLTAFEAYDPRTRQWQRLPDLPTRRGGLAATATCSGHVVAVGGEAAETFAEVEAFDVAAGLWRRLPDLPTPRHGLGVVAIGTTVYTLAGGPHPGLHVAAATEALDLAALGPCR